MHCPDCWNRCMFLGHAHKPWVLSQNTVKQSALDWQASRTPQLGQFGPPQSLSVSWLSTMPSLQFSAQRPARALIADAVAADQAKVGWGPQAGQLPPPQSTPVSAAVRDLVRAGRGLTRRRLANELDAVGAFDALLADVAQGAAAAAAIDVALVAVLRAVHALRHDALILQADETVWCTGCCRSTRRIDRRRRRPCLHRSCTWRTRARRVMRHAGDAAVVGAGRCRRRGCLACPPPSSRCRRRRSSPPDSRRGLGPWLVDHWGRSRCRKRCWCRSLADRDFWGFGHIAGSHIGAPPDPPLPPAAGRSPCSSSMSSSSSTSRRRRSTSNVIEPVVVVVAAAAPVELSW